MSRLSPSSSFALGLLFLLSPLSLSGCDALKPDPAAVATARQAFEYLRHDEKGAFEALSTTREGTEEADRVLGLIHDLIPPGDPVSSKTVGWQIYEGGEGSYVGVTQQYDYGDRTLSVGMKLVHGPQPGQWLVKSVKVGVPRPK